MAIDRSGLAALMEREERAFVDAHPRSAELFERARASLLGGVPMNWMSKWPGAFPPYLVARCCRGKAPRCVSRSRLPRWADAAGSPPRIWAAQSIASVRPRPRASRQKRTCLAARSGVWKKQVSGNSQGVISHDSNYV